jgi:hypothetical protein
MTQTISAYALSHGHDRRTLKRRLLAAGIQPKSIIGRAEYYEVRDLESVMLDPKDPTGFERMGEKDKILIAAFGFLGERFPDCMDSALIHLKLSEEKRDVLTLRFWAAMAQVVIKAVHPPMDGVGTVPLIHSNAILEIAAKHNIALDDTGMNSLLN